MFRASLCSSSGGQLYIYSIWCRPTLYAAIQCTDRCTVCCHAVHRSVPETCRVSWQKKFWILDASCWLFIWSRINVSRFMDVIDWLDRYARSVDHLTVRNVAQGAPLAGGSTLHPNYTNTYQRNILPFYKTTFKTCVPKCVQTWTRDKVIPKTMEARNSQNTRLAKKKGSCRISIVRWAWLLGYISSPQWNPPRPLLHAMQPSRTHRQKPSRTTYRIIYRGADKSLARLGRKQATATEDFDFHIP
jgi:hypothetical protein